MPPSPSSPSHLHLPHLSSSSSVIFLICHLHLLHTSRLMPHASITLSYTKPPSLPLTHTSLHQSTSTTNLHTLASTCRPPWLLHTLASTPNESASAATSTCRPPHAVLLTRVDLFILTVTFSLFNFLITLSLFCILGFV